MKLSPNKSILITFFSIFILFSCEENEPSKENNTDNIEEEIASNIDPIPEEEDNATSKEDLDKSSNISNVFAEEVLILVNKARANEGLSSLKLNSALNLAAYLHSKDMKEQNYFDHIGKNGSEFYERAQQAGYNGFATGENIAYSINTAESVFDTWMNSSGHRENILKPTHTEMGIGEFDSYWTQLFGR